MDYTLRHQNHPFDKNTNTNIYIICVMVSVILFVGIIFCLCKIIKGRGVGVANIQHEENMGVTTFCNTNHSNCIEMKPPAYDEVTKNETKSNEDPPSYLEAL